MKRWIALTVLLCGPLAADEGMWLPSQLPELGDGLSKSLTDYPLGAVVWLGGCTGSFVSPQGLVATNHHCARGSIQFNSSPESNLLRDGFLAAAVEDELPAAPGSRIYMTVAVDDVTATVHAAASEKEGLARWQAIETAEKELVARCEEDLGHRCRVEAFYGGMQYLLFKQLEIRDVRLVYAPAGSVGEFGGDVDNWMWPRHTGDFSFLRAYVGPDGKPADNAPENLPFRPPHWLRLAPEGLEDGDFAMVAGFPGSTKRHVLAEEVENAFEWYYPARIEAYEQALAIIEEETRGREAAVIAYATTVAGLNNGLKNNQGMLAGLGQSGLMAHKERVEAGLARWIAEDPVRLARWGSSLEELGQLAAAERATQERDLVNQMLDRRTLLGTARKLVRLAHESTKPDAERAPGYQDRDLSKIRSDLQRLERRFDARVDQALFSHFLLAAATLPDNQRIAGLDSTFGLRGGPPENALLERRLDDLYAGTRLDELDVRLSLMGASLEEMAEGSDPFIALALALLPGDLAAEDEDDRLSGEGTRIRPQYMEALTSYLESQGHPLYPDANSTLRITYGKVAGYRPRDAIRFDPFTTADGLLEKETGVEPFNSPPELLAAIRKRELGGYVAESLGSLAVNFLATLDITGGNSGSPVLNSKGELVGLAFDGNWESMVSDWVFLPPVTRTIAVDVRYMLWVMDRVDRAHHLLREMGIEPRFEP